MGSDTSRVGAKLSLRWVDAGAPVSATDVEARTATIDEADALRSHLDRLHEAASAASYPHAVNLSHSTAGNELSLTVGADRSFLQFMRGDDPNPWESQGDYPDEGALTFFADSHHTEVPGSFCVSWNDATQAAIEFHESGELPSNLTWERAW